MQRLLQLGFKNVFSKFNLRIRHTNYLAASNNGSASESIINRHLDLYNDASINVNERMVFNGDLVDIAPYEHYFVLTDATEQKKTPQGEPFQDIQATYAKIKSFDILDGILELRRQTNFPKKISDTMEILERKILHLYPDYVFDRSRAINSNFVYKYVKDIISNTAVNASYIEVSMQMGLFPRAFHFMKKVRMENNSSQCLLYRSLIVSPVFYEPVSALLAKTGKLDPILSFMTELEEAHIIPSFSMIFYCLEAAGRKETIDEKVIQQMLSYIEKHGITLKKAFLEVPIYKENFPFIMKAIQTVERDFNFDSYNSMVPTVTKNNLKTSSINSRIDELSKLFDAQLQLEKTGETALSFLSSNREEEVLLKKLSDIEQKWRDDLTVAVEKRLNTLSSSDRWKLYPFLGSIPVNTCINVMISILYRCMNEKFIEFTNISNLFLLIGETFENHYRQQFLHKEKHFNRLKLVYNSFLKKLQANPNNVRLNDLWDQTVIENIENGNMKSRYLPWSKKLRNKIGRLLYEIMFENLSITFRDKNGIETKTPVLYEEFVEESDLSYTAVRVQSKVTSMFKVINKASLRLSAIDLPMLHPPVPIHDNYSTGYFHLFNYATRLVRKSNSVELYDEDLRQAGNISNIYNALNVLSMCAWEINAENLDIMTKVFQDKGDMKLQIPSRYEDIEPPKSPRNIGDYKNYAQYMKDMRLYRKEMKEMYSLWVTMLYKINAAEILRGKKFWFPYSMDFRSRVYPCPPHLNHTGNDTSRGLMKFALGKKLGPKGLDWLKIHLINLCGFHKRSSNSDRLQAANTVIPEIIDSVTNPLNGKKWWMESEHPWQTLATCRELFNAMRFADEHGKGVADEFVSHLGVHQDGSCNGLQHYAALGRDSEGARAVNLFEMDAPQDVYSDVLNDVIKKMKTDMANGVEEAALLHNIVTRKVIKQTVMTNVYGVTMYGAMNQIMKQLKDLESLPKEKMNQCSLYLSKAVFSTIGEMFSSASKIQNWLVELASNICKHRHTNISWITPLNLLVTQPYYDIKNQNTLKTDRRKNQNAFPPNFIHSLDSTHMMMTALKCWERNVTFVSVHDCYWTHACDVDALNKICREEFVEIYKRPILEDLSEFLCRTYGFHETDKNPLTKEQKQFNRLLKKIPKKGNYNIEEVLKATYFFS